MTAPQQQNQDVPAEDSPETKPFHMEANPRLASMWDEYVMRMIQMRESKKWVKEFQAQVYRESKNRDIWIKGRKVATYAQDGQFTRSWFEKEQPELTQKYTRLVTTEELDVEALRRDHPDIFEQYRAPTIRLENNPTIVP